MSSAASPRDYSLRTATHGGQVTLAPHLACVRTGTPLVADPRGWQIALLGQVPMAYAGTFGGPSAKIQAYRTVTLQAAEDLFEPGKTYRIADILWNGHPVFAKDPEGPYRAWSPSEITLDVGDAGSLAALRGAREAVPSPAASPPVDAHSPADLTELNAPTSD